MLIQALFILILMVSSISSALPSLSLCENGSSIYNSPDEKRLRAVVLREFSSNKVEMEQAFDDTLCWLQKNFDIRESFSVNTQKDTDRMCFKMATAPIQGGEMMIVLTEGDSIRDCHFNIYGVIPTILNVKMFIDMKSTSAKTYTKRMELSFRNAGGYLGVQFELHRSTAYPRIQKTLSFMMQMNNLNYNYGELLPWWEPLDYHLEPPMTYQIKYTQEEHEELIKTNTSISILMMISCLPMIVFGTVVSCYLVIHPRGGLTYTDEELDFVIHEVESVNNSMMNTALEKSAGKNAISMSAIMSAEEPTQTRSADNSKKDIVTTKSTKTVVEKLPPPPPPTPPSKEKPEVVVVVEKPMELHTPPVLDELTLDKTPLSRSVRKPVDENNIDGNNPEPANTNMDVKLVINNALSAEANPKNN